MNRIQAYFSGKPRQTLNVYCTAGYPGRDDLLPVLEGLQEGGADLVEIGIPFSDPTADGPTIQLSNQVALKNGMTLRLLFDQLRSLRPRIKLPALLMGYLNPVLQYGFERFLDDCVACGIDGVILPDLPIREFRSRYKQAFDDRGLSNVFLITPQTTEGRIREIDELSNAFVYVVSTYATTGGAATFDDNQRRYFARIQAMGLSNPTLIGFGIHDRATYLEACRYADGAIIGSSFIRYLENSADVRADSAKFVRSIRA